MIGRIWTAAFAQGSLRLWAIILGAPPLCAMILWQIWMIRYGWSPERAEQQLTILGWSLVGTILLVGIIVVALATVKVKATTPAGSVEIDGDDG